MKDLYLFRHAKSSWKDENLTDYERPLNKRGRLAAPLMAEWMISHEIAPEMIYCSKSHRTRETCELVLKAGLVCGAVIYEKSLYLASETKIISLLKKLSDDTSSVMIIGHNPGLHLLLVSLMKGLAKQTDTPDMHQHLLKKFPTAGFAHLQFDCESWSEVAPMGGRLYRLIAPKLITA